MALTASSANLFVPNSGNPRFLNCPDAKTQRGLSEKVQQKLLTQVTLITEGQKLEVPTSYLEFPTAELAAKAAVKLNRIVNGGNNSFL